MNLDYLTNIICENILKNINEGWYDDTATPIHSKGDTQRNLGVNPLYVDNGGHSSADKIRQASTVDYNGAGFVGKKIVVSDNKFTIYKLQNFGSENIKGTKQFFSDTKDLRRAIDTVNGAASRNGKQVQFRFITSQSNADKRDNVLSFTFCEFSFDGYTWYILKPNPVQTMKQSKLRFS